MRRALARRSNREETMTADEYTSLLADGPQIRARLRELHRADIIQRQKRLTAMMLDLADDLHVSDGALTTDEWLQFLADTQVMLSGFIVMAKRNGAHPTT